MKSLILVASFCMVTSVANSANVVWDCIELSHGGTYDGVYYYSIVYPYVSFSGMMNGAVLTLWADANEYMEISSMWCLANKGEMASVEIIVDKGEYFYAADFAKGDEMTTVKTDYPIIVEAGSSVYLEMICKTYSRPEDVAVGWVELACDDKGVLGVVHSAVDTGGESLIVGGGVIPEPRGGSLILAGLLVLTLRRPSGKGLFVDHGE